MLFRLVRVPPSTTLPSACTTSALTWPLICAPEAKEVFSVPSALSQAKPPSWVPSVPPARRTPTAFTGPSTLGLKEVSGTLSLLKRTRLLEEVPPNAEKAPPTRIRPSAWTASELITAPVGPPALGAYDVSREPSALIRASWLRTTGTDVPAGWSVVKEPPIKTLPSACRA